jgi:hypothetical protein
MKMYLHFCVHTECKSLLFIRAKMLKPNMQTAVKHKGNYIFQHYYAVCAFHNKLSLNSLFLCRCVSIVIMNVNWSKDLSLLVFCTMPLGKLFLTFLRIIVPSYSRLSSCTLKVEAIKFFNTSETIYPPTLCNISEVLYL